MKHLFVPYDIAVMAKEKGFNEKCLGYINENGKTFLFDVMMLDREGLEDNDKYKGILSPLYQQLLDWFLANHGITIFKVPLRDDDENENDILWLYCAHDIKKKGEDSYMTLKVNLDESLREVFKQF
jgi:hypothetical protein